MKNRSSKHKDIRKNIMQVQSVERCGRHGSGSKNGVSLLNTCHTESNEVSDG